MALDVTDLIRQMSTPTITPGTAQLWQQLAATPQYPMPRDAIARLSAARFPVAQVTPAAALPVRTSTMSGPAALEGLGGLSSTKTVTPNKTGLLSKLTGDGKVGLMRYAGAGMAGFGAQSLASQLTGDDPSTAWDDALSWGAGGAAAGAVLGAPFGGVGAIPGSVIGGLGGLAAGAGYGLLSGSRDPRDPEKIAKARADGEQKLAQVVAGLGLTTEGERSLRAYLDPVVAMAQSADEVKAAYQQIGQLMPQIAAEDEVRRQQIADQQYRAAQVAAISSMLAPQIREQSALSNQYAGDMATAMRAAAAKVSNPELRAIYESRAAAVPLANAQATQAALQQIALAPAAFAAQGELQSRLAREAQLAGNAGYAGTGSIEQLLAQLGYPLPTRSVRVAPLPGGTPNRLPPPHLGGGVGAQPPPVVPSNPGNFTKLTNKWQEFSPFADQFPADVVQALVDYDAERVARGTQPLTREQTIKAAVAARDNRQVTQESQRSASPLSIPQNALGDLRTIIEALPRLPVAMVREVQEVPRFAQRVAEERAAGASPLQAWARAPGIRMLPGAYVVENLESPAELLRHPLFTALDVAPVAKGAKLGERLAGTTVGQATTNWASKLKRTTRTGQLFTEAFGKDSRDVARMMEERPARITAMMNGVIEPIDNIERMARDSPELGAKFGLTKDEVIATTAAGQIGLSNNLSGKQLAFLDEARRLSTQQGFDLARFDEIGALQIDGRVEFYPRHQASKIARARDLAAFADRVSQVRAEVLSPSGVLSLDDFDAGLDSATQTARTSKALGLIEARAALYGLDAYGFDSSQLRTVATREGPAAALEAFRQARASGVFDQPQVRYSQDQIVSELRRFRHDTMADRLATAIADGNTTRVTQSLDALLRRTKSRPPYLDDEFFVSSVRSLRDRLRFDESTLRKYTPKRVEVLNRRAERAVTQTPPARFGPLIGRESARQMTAEVMPARATPQQVEEITRAVAEMRWNDLGAMTGRETAELHALRESIIKDVSSTWRDLQAAGHDPVFTHRVSRHRVGTLARPRIGPVPQNLTQARERFFDWGEPTGNLEVSLTHQAVEFLSRRASEDVIDVIVRKYGVRESDLRSRFAPSARVAAEHTTLGYGFEDALRDLMEREFEVFNPDQRGYAWGGSKLDAFRQEQWWIPKPLANNLHRIASPKGPISTAIDPITKTFRYSVIGLSPRTHLYNILGGAVMLFGQAGPRGFMNLRRAWDMVKDPASLTDETVRATLGSQARHFTDAEFARASASAQWGRTLARVLNEQQMDAATRAVKGTGQVIHKSLKINGQFDDMYRVAAYLSGRDKALTKGLTQEAAEAAGRELMRKTMMDWTALTPIERSIFKSVFPFYGFMSHALRYVSRYPVDHPLRAQVVSAFGRAEEEDLGALPSSFLSAVFVGEPDANRNALQLRGVNPFSDVGNLFTVAGFLSATNPVFTTALEQVGVIQGEAELYPTLRYDPSTGRLAAQRRNPLLALTENVIPQTAIASALLGWNAEFAERMRRDPAGARRSLLSAGGIPVVWRNYNVTGEIAKAEIARQASQDLAKQQALESGDWTKALRYPGLQGYYQALQQLPPEVLAAFEPQTREQVAEQIRLLVSPRAPASAQGGGL